jgi:hypothetical protein
MLSLNLQEIAANVVRRAQRQGFVVPREVREETTQAGLPDEHWKDVLSLARPSLSLRGGRYYFVPSASMCRKREEAHHKAIHRTIRKLVRDYRAAAAERVDRRGENRFDYIQPVTVVTEEGKKHHLLVRDLSSTGIRLVGTRRLLGQKVHVQISDDQEKPPVSFLVRILWTCAVGDDLFENGGRFLEVEEAEGRTPSE